MFVKPCLHIAKKLAGAFFKKATFLFKPGGVPRGGKSFARKIVYLKKTEKSRRKALRKAKMP